MQTDISLTGRVLPAPFVRGYMSGLGFLTGTDIWKGYHMSGIARFVPKAERQQWYNVLLPYYDDKNGLPKPLDYTVLRILQANMIDDGETEAMEMRGIARTYTFKVGRGWWQGVAPVSIARNYGLKKMFVPYILKQLDSSIEDTKFKRYGVIKNAILCIQSFAYALQRSSGIKFLIQHEPDRVIVTIEECPFCYHSENCLLFWGIFTELLAWMHSRHTVAEFTEVASLNRQTSESHTIIIDLKNM